MTAGAASAAPFFCVPELVITQHLFDSALVVGPSSAPGSAGRTTTHEGGIGIGMPELHPGPRVEGPTRTAGSRQAHCPHHCRSAATARERAPAVPT